MTKKDDKMSKNKSPRSLAIHVFIDFRHFFVRKFTREDIIRKKADLCFSITNFAKFEVLLRFNLSN